MFKYLKKNNEYMTRKSTWAAIQHLIPKDKVLWEAFRGNGQSAKFLRELGFEVICKEEDFFKSDIPANSICCSNPPFFVTDRIFRRLYENDVPFILIVPLCKITTQYFKQIFKTDEERSNIQMIVPAKRIQFDNVCNPTCKDKCSFDTIYLCYKIGLKQQIIWLD